MTDTVLIVDDSTFIVEGLVALLRKTYHTIPSYGGEECLSLLRTIKPSIIILDIMMEPMDGWETLSRIKENPATRHIPVLMFSAKKISPKEAETHRIIIDDFLTKPVNPKKLLEAIARVLARQEFNKKIQKSWNAAGVSPDIIDEYLTLKTNLDVDVSLLAVMKKQLDIAYPDAVNREELEESIAALEERIGVSRARINTFCEERAWILPVLDKDDIMSSSPGAEPARGSDYPGPEPEEARPIPTAGPAAHPVAELPPNGDRTGIPRVPERENPPESAHGIFSPAGVPLQEPEASPSTPLSPPLGPVVTTPFPQPEPVLHPALTANAVGRDQEARVSTPGIRVLPEGRPSYDAAGEVAPKPVDPYPLFDPFEDIHGSGHKTDTGNMVNYSPEISLSRTRPEQDAPPFVVPGAGTETPSMLSPSTTRRPDRLAKEEQQPKKPVPAPTGFISRIIAAVAALFGRKKP
jgi:two-component system, OmpR family, response regulator